MWLIVVFSGSIATLGGESCFRAVITSIWTLKGALLFRLNTGICSRLLVSRVLLWRPTPKIAAYYCTQKPNGKPFYRRSKHYRPLLIGYATTLELDGNGRVLVPPTLRDYGNLGKKLMLVGLGKKFELWNEDDWLQTVAATEDDEMPAEMLSLSL